MKGAVVFPLFGITAEGSCACGLVSCARVGKHPRVSWRELKLGQEVPRPEPGAGYAIKTGAAPRGSDVFVVDLDGEEAAAAFDSMGPCPETMTVSTGRGLHLYFKHPGFHVKTSSGELGPKIDVRGDGGIVVGPGSPHRSGAVYEIARELEPAEAPAWLLDWLRAQPKPAEAQPHVDDVDEPVELERRRALYAEYLATAAPCVKGNGGDQQLFTVVQRGAYDLRLPTHDVLELVREVYDPRCDPPWGAELEERVHHKSDSAKTSSTRPRAEPLPADLAHLALAAPTALDLVLEKPPEEGFARDAHFSTRIRRGADWHEAYVRPPYLLDPIIPRMTLTTLFAEGGSLKTWASLELAIAVATGEPWLGKYPVQQGRVLILDFEDGWGEYRRRKELLSRKRGLLDLSQLDYLYAGPNIADQGLWKYLAGEGYALIVVDALASGMPAGSDENDQTFSDGLKLAGRFVEYTGSNLVVIHHANKGGNMRGSTTIRDQSDCVFKFEPVSETDNVKRMRLVCDKPGPQKRPPPVNLELSDEGLRTFVDEGSDVARNVSTYDQRKAAIKALLAAGPLNTSDIKAAVKGKTDMTNLAIKSLVQSGEIVSLGPRLGYRLDTPAERTQRVLAAVRNDQSFDTAADVAAAASVAVADVEGLIADATIKPRLSGAKAGGYIIRAG